MSIASEQRRAIEIELARYGLRPQYETIRGGHVRVTWRTPGGEQSMITATSPSDWRAPRNARAVVRRKLRQAGVIAARVSCQL